MNKGFIALTIVLFISTVMLVLASSRLIELGHFIDLVAHKEYRLMKYYNAYSCIDEAISELAHDYFFIAEIPISIPEFSCSILKILADGENRYILARGDYQKACVYRSAIVKMKIHDPNII